MKQQRCHLTPEHHKVAPHAGAWIETKPVNCIRTWFGMVAPHAGAWIET